MEDFTEFEQIERFMKNRDIARAKDLREFGISGTAISRAAAEDRLRQYPNTGHLAAR